MRTVNILGSRGIPGNHGGFETFAEELAIFLSKRGWTVRVYCQVEGAAGAKSEDNWNGIQRINIASPDTPLGTIHFDLKSVMDVRARDGVDLVLGYNTGIFTLLQKVFRRTVVVNMDGVEYHRNKWGTSARLWFRCNEYFAARASDIVIADHPEIRAFLEGKYRWLTCKMIPYGGPEVRQVPIERLSHFPIEPGRYFVSIARIEPENSILELVRAFESAKPPAHKFVVLGRLNPENAYHRAVRSAAGENVHFAGAIYDAEIVSALRYHCCAYLHGHTVGGTNPSLVEALGAGNAIIAHANRYNQWVAGPEQAYFLNVDFCAEGLRAIATNAGLRQAMQRAARARFEQRFTWERILAEYEHQLNLGLRAARSDADAMVDGQDSDVLPVDPVMHSARMPRSTRQ